MHVQVILVKTEEHVMTWPMTSSANAHLDTLGQHAPCKYNRDIFSFAFCSVWCNLQV